MQYLKQPGFWFAVVVVMVGAGIAAAVVMKVTD